MEAGGGGRAVGAKNARPYRVATSVVYKKGTSIRGGVGRGESWDKEEEGEREESLEPHVFRGLGVLLFPRLWWNVRCLLEKSM